MRASSFLSVDDGISTVSWAAMIPLRMRVRKSAMGSVMLMPGRLPARLGHAGDVALVRELAQADAAEPELLVHRTRSAALAAARVSAGLVLRRPRGADDLGGLGHVVSSLSVPQAATAWSFKDSKPAERPSREKGMPSASNSANASASVCAVVVIVTSIPRTWSMLS